MDENTNESNGYQVIICNISWNKETTRSYHVKKDDSVELPDQFTLDIPENVLRQATKKKNDFNDVIESFCYNFLTHKFNHEIYKCQIWLSLDDPADYIK